MKKLFFGGDRQRHLQLRIEAINALNHALFINPDLNPASASFGTVAQQWNLPRYFQIGAKLVF